MEVTIEMLLIVCPLVFLAATVDAIGGGGGLISLPAYLLAGLPPALAGGSNKLSAGMGTLIATFKFFKDGKILLKPGLCAVLGALPGAWIGAQLLQMVDEQIIQIFLLVAIPLVAVLMLVKRSTPTQVKPITTARLVGCFGLGLGCGLYDGFFGPGTGTLIIMGLTYLIGMVSVSLVFLLLHVLTGGNGLGMGDVKLVAAAGLLLGWQKILLAVLLGSVAGALIHSVRMTRGAARRLAFGPYLAAGIWFAALVGGPLIQAYLGLFGL